MEYARHARTGLGLTALGLLVAVGGIGLVLERSLSLDCGDAGPGCVAFEDLADGAPLPEAIHIHDRHGQVMADVAGPRRRTLAYHEIPDRVAEAFVAVEDRRFRDHEGIDAFGVARAAVRNVVAGDIEEGASTIPMQLVRSVWAEQLRGVGPWRRKVIEARTAPRLVESLGHDRVLALYLNALYMGDGTYGVEQAARHWFGVPASRLEPAQLATLVGMARGPEYYHPRRHPERTRARRDVVLGVLADAGVISEAEAATARATPLEVVPASADNGRSYFTAAVTREIRERAPHLAGRPGLRVFTTVDPVLQAAGEEALVRRLRAVEGEAQDDLGPLQGAAVALDPADGAVRAWIGGRDFSRSEFDRVDQARRPVGSLVKPFLVALALERGASILDIVSTQAVTVHTAAGAWTPADHVEAGHMTLREALVESSNRAAVHLGQALGYDAARRAGRQVGLEGEIPAVPAASLGAFDASLLELVQAYAPFGNGGRRVEPYLISRIEDVDGTVLWHRTTPPPSQPVLSEATSWVVLDALSDVVGRGTAWGVRRAGFQGPAAGKTGTTNDGQDAWFVGLTHGLVAGVWVGYDAPRPIASNASGGGIAAPTWGEWMLEADAESLSVGGWKRPLGVVEVRYDPATGRAYPASCREDDLPRASVPTATHVDICPGTLRRWATSLWHTVSPPKVQPLTARSLERSGGPR